ncbi:MAG: AAA family ATPase [Deltaproteobacteria bacterium]|nr:AAA family ATPase [Deltaproteobacteria bacterium]
MKKLSPDDLYRICDETNFPFKNTDELDGEYKIIGQEKAIKSLDFGLGMKSPGFNIFVLGESGTGRMSVVTNLLKEIAKNNPTPNDWCYVYNFKDPDSPSAISLEPGRGPEFQKDMEELIKYLKTEIPKAFESKEYEVQKNRIIGEFHEKQEQYLRKLDEDARSQGFSLRRTPAGVLIVPSKPNGEPLTREEFESLDEMTKKSLEEKGKMLQEQLNDILRTLKQAERLVTEMVSKLEKMIVLEVLEPSIGTLKSKYINNDKIVTYLEDVKEDILANVDDFRLQQETPLPVPFLKLPKVEPSFTKYSVNVLITNGETKGAPVVFESNPSYLNLFGRIEYKYLYGIAVTDFTMIRPGALHKANGGYLILYIEDILKNIFSYDALKRALKNREVKIEDVLEQYRLMSTSALKPEPIPLDVKVVLIGNPLFYYLLYNFDEELRDLFKVKADFDNRMERTEENILKYAYFISFIQKTENLLPFDRGACARVVEYGSRLAEHKDKLSTRFGQIADLLREADYWARKDGSTVVGSKHVLKALDEKVYRVNRIEERLRDMMLEGTLIVDTEGEKVGQVNGLAVLDLGDYSFGKPSRITAKTYAGRAGIVNIERETKMSGRIHDKAIFIISSYLGSKYALKKPITLSASITFEQLYEMVEGDSATCAELYALLSSISNLPIKQSFAVTGSMDQNGEVQPVGGINEKIEGFFELCRMRGLDGTHGVIIPERNIKHLMLKKDVVDAVREGKFSIYAIEKMEEGLEILTGIPAGTISEDGTYPTGTVNYLVLKRLTEISEMVEKKKEEEEEKKKKDEADNL